MITVEQLKVEWQRPPWDDGCLPETCWDQGVPRVSDIKLSLWRWSIWQWWWPLVDGNDDDWSPSIVIMGSLQHLLCHRSLAARASLYIPMVVACGWLGEHQLRLLKTVSRIFLTLIHTTWPWPWPWWNTELKTAMSGQFRNFKSSKDKIYRR